MTETLGLGKVKDLLDIAKAEIKTEKGKKIISLIKSHLKDIESCKKTLRKLEKKYNELLETDISEIELEEWRY